MTLFLIEFLHDPYELGVQYSGIRTARSDLSGFFSLCSEGQIDIGNSVLVRKFMKGVFNKSSLQCYSVLCVILVKKELCIPLERRSNVLSTGEGFICLSPPSTRKIAVLFCSIYKKTISFSAIVF